VLRGLLSSSQHLDLLWVPSGMLPIGYQGLFLVAKRAGSVILKMEVAGSIETFVPMNQIIQRHFPEGSVFCYDEYK
jgi:hypothetical protein